MGSESIWLLADRRLSRKGHPPRDDGRKVMLLDTPDGRAILGYAGLGATALGTEPADWMTAVLRGRNFPLEQSLGILATAIQQQLPRHLGRGALSHHVMIPALVGHEVRFYSIDLALAPDRFRYTRHFVVPRPGVHMTHRLAIGGSGERHLTRHNTWRRPLLRVVNACERGAISPRAVADHLARLNHDVHLTDPNGMVGPHSIVTWRFCEGADQKGGGGHQCYTGVNPEASSPALPTVVAGMDLTAVVEVMWPHMTKHLTDRLAGRPVPELNMEEINDELKQLPDTPDEDLR